jgi:hypothetical protein
MPRVPMDHFEEGDEIVRVYLAAKVREGERVEAALDAAGVAYAVEVEAFTTPNVLLGVTRRSGAGFWVAAGDVDGAAAALERAGLVAGLVDRG